MRILIGAMAVAMLAGCVSPSDLESNDPSLQLVTAKSPKQYALCVFPKWQMARTDSSMVETETGYRLWVATNGMTDELLDIKNTTNGSAVILYERMPWSPMLGRSSIKASLNSCL